MAEQQGEMKKLVGRIISYSVHYNGVLPPRVIFSGTLAITSEVGIDEAVDPHSLYEYIRSTAISAAKDATFGQWNGEADESFSVVITHHFYP